MLLAHNFITQVKVFPVKIRNSSWKSNIARRAILHKIRKSRWRMLLLPMNTENYGYLVMTIVLRIFIVIATGCLHSYWIGHHMAINSGIMDSLFTEKRVILSSCLFVKWNFINFMNIEKRIKILFLSILVKWCPTPKHSCYLSCLSCL